MTIKIELSPENVEKVIEAIATQANALIGDIRTQAQAQIKAQERVESVEVVSDEDQGIRG
jgi:hypothetical protein